MSEANHACLVCDRTREEIPLITLEYREQFFYICPEHFPILIHNPQQLTGKLPGVENLDAHQH